MFKAGPRITVLIEITQVLLAIFSLGKKGTLFRLAFYMAVQERETHMFDYSVDGLGFPARVKIMA